MHGGRGDGADTAAAARPRRQSWPRPRPRPRPRHATTPPPRYDTTRHHDTTPRHTPDTATPRETTRHDGELTAHLRGGVARAAAHAPRRRRRARGRDLLGDGPLLHVPPRAHRLGRAPDLVHLGVLPDAVEAAEREVGRPGLGWDGGLGPGSASRMPTPNDGTQRRRRRDPDGRTASQPQGEHTFFPRREMVLSIPVIPYVPGPGVSLGMVRPGRSPVPNLVVPERRLTVMATRAGAIP